MIKKSDFSFFTESADLFLSLYTVFTKHCKFYRIKRDHSEKNSPLLVFDTIDENNEDFWWFIETQ